MDAKTHYQAWLNDPLIDDDTKAELSALQDQPEEIEDRFYKWLEFGTGGLRGTIGAGTNRMNVYTVRLATQALADTLTGKGRGRAAVVIAYDSRRMSREFAQAAAGVLVGNGIPVYMFPGVAPTPLLSFAVRYLEAGAGIVITASHNPPDYNGYKVYNAAGCQILTEEASQISAQMMGLSLEDVRLHADPLHSPLLTVLDDEVVEAYYGRLLEVVPAPTEKELRVLYTPLHGTGGRFIPEVLRRSGFRRISTVTEQLEPDSRFPTVNSPNPEDAAAFELAFRQGEEEGADLILATDPDADRMGAAVWHQGRWVLLNGNHMGVLLADYLLSCLDPEQLQEGVIIKTIVSTEMIEPLARKHGVEVQQTLTGFKYIGALMDTLPAAGKQFVFGFEESYGFLAGTHVRDKDAVAASLLAASAASYYASQGLTLVDRLEELFQEYGYYLQDLSSFSFATSREAERSRAFVERVRKSPLTMIGSERVKEVLDYQSGVHLDLETGRSKPLDFPKAGVLQWITEGGSRVSLRPSGTEPKMKLYLEVQGGSYVEAQARLDELKKACHQLIEAGLQN